jgi:hypothetical protein
VISITSGPLPSIENQLTLDGTSQPACAAPCIVLSGASLAGDNVGITVMADNSIIKGFIITSWSSIGILITGDGNYIQSNVIGFWPGNPALLPNGTGISIMGSNNLIGGLVSTERNVISGNSGFGIVLANGVTPGITGNTFLGNYIGTNAAGTGRLGNGANGIMVLADASYTTIGGTVSGAGNVISANGTTGIDVAGSHTLIRGNFIGTRADGSGSLGNAQEGIYVSGYSTGNVIGGASGTTKNRIAHNGFSGIVIDTLGNGRTTIRHNLIYANGGLGIDLDNDGVTPNDALDGDSGPNWLQNYPVIPSAISATGVIIARLSSQANSTYTIEFFSSPAGTCDASTHGEARNYLGSTTGTTDPTGYVRVVYHSPLAFAVGSVITATATDGTGRTSEFSKCRTAQ